MGIARNILENSDIIGTKSKEPKVKVKNYNLLDYSDVTQKKQSSRAIRDPLNPIYMVKAANG